MPLSVSPPSKPTNAPMMVLMEDPIMGKISLRSMPSTVINAYSSDPIVVMVMAASVVTAIMRMALIVDLCSCMA